jgi:hypothetical protein
MILIASAIEIQAQIPNNGFENWSTSGNCLIPQGWGCLNDWMGETENCYSVSRSQDHYPSSIGSFSIKIENRVSILPDAGAGGMVWTGDSTGFGTDQPVFPIIGHPTSLCGYYKFLPENGDTMDIHFVLYKNGVDIAGGKLLVRTAVPEWTAFSIPVTNPEYEDAESARILMSSFNADNFPALHGNSVMYVDNLSFDVLITTSDESNNSNAFFRLSPNPADDAVRFIFSRSVNNSATLEIYNQIGVKVRSEKLKQNQQTINTAGLSEGIYFVVLTSRDYTCNQKLIIQR